MQVEFVSSFSSRGEEVCYSNLAQIIEQGRTENYKLKTDTQQAFTQRNARGKWRTRNYSYLQYATHTHTIHCPLGRGRVQVCGIVQTWPCKADASSCSLLHDENASTRTWHASPRAAATTGVNFCTMFIGSTRKTQNEKNTSRMRNL